MRKILTALSLVVSLGAVASAEEIQGLIVDRSCVQDIVKNGRQATLQQRPDCSLRRHYVRSNYALVTEDKRYYTFDETGNKKALALIKGTPNRDDLKVVVTGDIKNGTITVKYMSIL